MRTTGRLEGAVGILAIVGALVEIGGTLYGIYRARKEEKRQEEGPPEPMIQREDDGEAFPLSELLSDHEKRIRRLERKAKVKGAP